MWWLYLLTLVLGGLIGFGLEKLGQFLYHKRVAKGSVSAVNGTKSNLTKMSSIPKSKSVDCVFLGDSITELYPIGEFYMGKNYLNRGISGDTTNGVLRRLSSQVIALQPKRVILLIGTNDLACGISPSEAANNIKEIIIKLQDSNINDIIIESVYPLNQYMHIHRTRTNKNIIQLNSLLINIAKQLQVKYIDTWACLSDNSGHLLKKYTYDGLHLNINGYEAITNYLLSQISDL